MGEAGKRRRVEDAATLRISDVVPRQRSALGSVIGGALTVRDPKTDEFVASISYSGEVRGAWGRITFAHTAAGQRWASPSYAVAIVAVAHPFGPRFRFRCPDSGDLVDALHMPSGADRFASRRAHGLSYASQSMRARRRAETRARQIRADLGGSPDLAMPFPDRPIGMWERTYLRRRAKAGAAVEMSGSAAAL